MDKHISCALDASLSSLVFTEQMQQRVLQQIQNLRTSDHSRQGSKFRRWWSLPAMAAATALLLIVAFLNRAAIFLKDAGDPIKNPSVVAGENATFVPIIIPATPSPTEEPASMFTHSPEPTIDPLAEVPVLAEADLTATPSATPTATPSPTPTATPTPTPTATPTSTPTATPTSTPTATPTSTPTATPAPTPIVKAVYDIAESFKFSHRSAILEVHPCGTSVLTLQFRHSYDLPVGAFMRLIRVDSTEGNFGEASITPALVEEGEKDLWGTTIICDRQFGKSQRLVVACFAPDGSEIFRVSYTLNYFNSADNTWPEPASTPPVPTLPPIAPTPAPSSSPGTTEPPYNTALVKCTYVLQDRPARYSHYNTTYRQYADFNTLNVFFFYNAELPEGAYMRVVSADNMAGDYGQAVIGPANVQGTNPSLLNAKIFTRTLPIFSTLTVECCTPEGEVLFPLVFNVSLVTYPAGGNTRPSGTATPVPPGYGYDHWNGFNGPSPTPWYPTIDTWGSWGNDYNTNNGTSWIEDGMQIQVPTPGGWGW